MYIIVFEIILGVSAKLRKATISFVISVLPHGTARFPLDGLWWNLILRSFSKIFREHSNVVKIRLEYRVLHMKTFSHLWQYLVKFFVELEMLQTKFLEKITTRILCPVTFFPKILVYEVMSKNLVEPGSPQMTSQYGRYVLHAGARTCMHTSTRSGSHTHAPTPARAHTYTHICNTYSFSTASVIRERAWVLTLCVPCLSCCVFKFLVTVCVYVYPFTVIWILFFSL